MRAHLASCGIVVETSLSRCRSDRCLSLNERKLDRQFKPSSSCRDPPISGHVNYWEYFLSYTAVIVPIIMLALMNGLVLHTLYQVRRRDNARDRCFQKPGCPTHDRLYNIRHSYKRSRRRIGHRSGFDTETSLFRDSVHAYKTQVPQIVCVQL